MSATHDPGRIGVNRPINTVPLYSRVERLTDLQRRKRAYQRSVGLSRSFNAGTSGTSSRSMSVGSNFVRPSHRRRAEGDGDGRARSRQARRGLPPATARGYGRAQCGYAPATASSGWRPAGRRAIGLARTGARRRPPTERQDFACAQSSPGLRPGPARLTKCSTVRPPFLVDVSSSTGCSAPKRFRGMPRTAHTEQLPRFVTGANCTTSGTPAVSSPAIQTVGSGRCRAVDPA